MHHQHPCPSCQTTTLQALCGEGCTLQENGEYAPLPCPGCRPDRHYHPCQHCKEVKPSNWCTAPYHQPNPDGSWAPVRCADCGRLPQYKRIETGSLQIDEDWPGLWVRGDDTARLLMGLSYLDALLPPAGDEQRITDIMARSALARLRELLSGCHVVPGADGTLSTVCQELQKIKRV